MINVSVGVDDKMTGQIDSIKRQLQRVPADGHKEFVKLTPIDRGNARRSTTLQGDQIQANYPYATRLDRGWSKQAPNGIVKPWEQWFRNRIRQIMGR
jgi:hypothetical protein